MKNSIFQETLIEPKARSIPPQTQRATQVRALLDSELDYFGDAFKDHYFSRLITLHENLSAMILPTLLLLKNKDYLASDKELNTIAGDNYTFYGQMIDTWKSFENELFEGVAEMRNLEQEFQAIQSTKQGIEK